MLLLFCPLVLSYFRALSFFIMISLIARLFAAPLRSLAKNHFRRASSGVSSGTLLSLACASGIFAVGVGFVAGYKASPSFAYMRIPSLS